jgi:catechol 2,3-dioxygenase-like lactoylglutathione lyase family enzyme
MDEQQGPLGPIELAATSLYVADLDRAVAWYQEKFGLQPAMVGSDGHGYASFMMGSAIVVLEPIEAALEPVEGNGNATVNVVVRRDPTEVRDELMRGGVPCGPLVDSPNFVSFLVRDRDGNRFYVTRPRSESARDAVRDASSG